MICKQCLGYGNIKTAYIESNGHLFDDVTESIEDCPTCRGTSLHKTKHLTTESADKALQAAIRAINDKKK